jgi:hypothetical protein
MSKHCIRDLVILIDWPISPPWLRYLSLSEVAQEFKVTFVEVKITERQKKAFSAGSWLEENILGARIEAENLRTLFNLVKRFQNAIVIDMLVAELLSYLVLNAALRRQNCKITNLILGMIPAHARKPPALLSRVVTKLGEEGFLKGISRLTSGVAKKIIKSLISYDYSVVGGLAAQNMLPRCSGTIIESIGYDFLEYSKTQGQKNHEAEFAILIEDNMFDDPDFILTGSDNCADAKTYFSSLSEYLKKFQEVTGVEIKVLPHPKSDRERLRGYLPEFGQIGEKSATAIIKARYVLMHASTAISFALLAGKPIIFIECNGLRQSIREGMEEMATFLGLRSYRIEELNKLTALGLEHLVPHDDRKTAFIDNFVRHPQATLFSFLEIVRFIRHDRPS